MDGTDDRTQGKVDELKGRAQEAYGDLTGDQEEQAKGESSQARGKVEQVKGDVKNAVDDLTG
jgi:uncharacterized protein YjbJ (UPF0337 family)